MDTRLCKFCDLVKGVSEFYSQNMCALCRKNRNKNASKLSRRKLYATHKDKIIAVNSAYYNNNKDKKKEYDKTYYLLNKDKRMAQSLVNHKRRMKEDPAYKIRSIVSVAIGKFIKKAGSSKNNLSILKYLPYTIQELKTHLEKQFEPWMTWGNHGAYRVDIWDDTDSSTWMWQIDHIIPHSTFKYTSMEDQEFKDCWALTNLRPYSAKKNIIDGARLL